MLAVHPFGYLPVNQANFSSAKLGQTAQYEKGLSLIKWGFWGLDSLLQNPVKSALNWISRTPDSPSSSKTRSPLLIFRGESAANR